MEDSNKLAKEIMTSALAGEDVDLYQQDPSDWNFLSEVIPGLVITSAGGLAPFQALGTLKGFPFYFRARNEWASLHLSAPGDIPFGTDVLYHAGMDAPFSLSDQDFCNLMMQLVSSLEKSPFRWEFEAYKLTMPESNSWAAIRTPEKTVEYGWGATPEEGWAETQLISDYLLEKGCDEETQKMYLELKDISRTPLNEDTRVFPEIEPVFEVKFHRASLLPWVS